MANSCFVDPHKHLAFSNVNAMISFDDLAGRRVYLCPRAWRTVYAIYGQGTASIGSILNSRYTHRAGHIAEPGWDTYVHRAMSHPSGRW